MNLDSRTAIKPVESNSDMTAFLRLPWLTQRQDPCWVPPILQEQALFLDPKRGPFFEIGEARYFLALREGAPVGRISAHVNRLHDQYQDPSTGFFGFFECIPDQETANALLEAAADWLASKGKRRIQGPQSFGIYDEVGLLVEGFDSLPAILQSHNPPYYEDLLTKWGFRKAIDWYAFKVTNHDIDQEAMERKLHRILDGQNLVIGCPRTKDIQERREEILDLFNEGWSDNWGHVPVTQAQFKFIFDLLGPILRPDMMDIILDGDKIVAFIINIPDINPLLQQMDGRLSLWNRLQLFWDARVLQPRRIRTLILGVRREYQRKKLHHALILNTYLRTVRNNKRWDYCDCSLVSEPLAHFIRTLESFGANRYKTFRIFEREISP